MTKITLIVDADGYVYETCAANEVETMWDEDIFTLHSDGPTCIRQFDSKIAALKKRLDADHVILTFTASDNFRAKVNPDYKSKRKTIRKPLAFTYVKEHAILNYETLTLPTLEGDDVCGILSSTQVGTDEKRIVVSFDKDLETISGWLYNPKQDSKPRWVTPEDANYKLYMQTLTGDVTDGYKGCPKMGPKTAEKLLFDLGNIRDETLVWKAIVKAYEKAGLTEADALANARCARILRKGDWSDELQAPILWTPQGSSVQLGE